MKLIIEQLEKRILQANIVRERGYYMQNIYRKEATEYTKEINNKFLDDNSLNIDDNEDFEFASKGLIAKLEEPIIRDKDGRIVFNLKEYDFLQGEKSPKTINPSLWRQAKLNMHHGLFKVTDKIYQVRGYDLAVITFIESESGYIVVDALTTIETAKAALKLVYENIGQKPILAVIYTHSHGDHWGGIKGIISEEEIESGKVRVIAPEDFMKFAVSENILAGNVMLRRAEYMYGKILPIDGKGNVDSGLGKTLVSGTKALVEPTESIKETGTKIIIDGIEIVFQLTPGAEAPVEMNLYFPQFKSLCMAENSTHVLHNLYTIRGAEVRDAKGWAKYINDSIELFAKDAEVVFATHHWPIWGNEKVIKYLKKQRDIYKYIHDQTLRLANHGYTMLEIAEKLKVPKSLAKEWHIRGCYGSISHNSKAVYQKYIGFYDGNPATLNQLPPEEAGKKYVEFMGGSEAVINNARKAFEKGEYRWVAQVLNHVVFAEPNNKEVKNLQADTLEQLGYQSESAAWRNAYLAAAFELRNGVERKDKAIKVGGSDIRIEDLFDLMSVRLNGIKAEDKRLIFNLRFTDENKNYEFILENSVINYNVHKQADDSDLTLNLKKRDLFEIVSGKEKLKDKVELGKIKAEGDISKFSELLYLLDEFELKFNIVTP